MSAKTRKNRFHVGRHAVPRKTATVTMGESRPNARSPQHLNLAPCLTIGGTGEDVTATSLRAISSVWLELAPHKRLVLGSNP